MKNQVSEFIDKQLEDGIEDFESSDNPEDNNQEFNDTPEEILDKPEFNSDSSSPDDNQDEFYEEEREKLKRKTNLDPANQRIRQTLNERYQALAMVDKLREENEQLRQLNDLTSQSASLYHEDLVNERFNNAKKLQEEAIESGDIKRQVEALTEMSLAAAAYQKVKDNKAQQEYYIHQERIRQEQQNANQYIQPDVRYAREVENWKANNTWYLPGSEDYDPHLANEVTLLTDRFDATLYRTGQENLILSPQYLREVDKYVSSRVNQSQNNQAFNQRRNIPMRNTNNTISPVRNGGRNSNQGQRLRSDIKLSSEERDISRRLGLTDKQYYDAKLADIRTTGNRRGDA